MNTENKMERITWIDCAKGILIVLMVFAHNIQFGFTGIDSINESILNRVYLAIYSFHMPCLMLISGYLFYYSIQKKHLLKEKVNLYLFYYIL